MFTSLDLLVLVFLAIAASTLLSLCLMFLIRNKIAKRIFFYVTLALGLFTAWGGFSIGFVGWFPGQIALSAVVVLMCVGAFVLERVCKKNDKMFLIARITSAAALVIGILNAFII